MTTAIDIITDAYERCNRLSPGETLSADDAAFGFRRLNLLVDELASQNLFLFLSKLVSASQSGSITLGAGDWASIAPGDEIVSATANNFAMDPISMKQYNEIYTPTITGLPRVWAQDGLNMVYLYPVPTGQTIKLQTRATVGKFADQLTDYVMPDGWASALGAGLAVRIAPNIIGKLPDALIRAETNAMGNISKYEPMIVNVSGFTESRNGNGWGILNGWR